jgi:hypothetical protein
VSAVLGERRLFYMMTAYLVLDGGWSGVLAGAWPKVGR